MPEVRYLTVFLLAAASAFPHDPITTALTWTRDVSGILHRRCAGCHRENGNAPMSLQSYRDARPWAVAIRNEVLSRRMPPWGSIRGYRDLQGDASLTQGEMDTIAQWVNGGAPEGDTGTPPAAAGYREEETAPAGRYVPIARAGSGVVIGIRPMTDVREARVWADLPEGGREPLIWLQGYKRDWNRTFVFREPLRLPKGSRIVSNPLVRLEVLYRQ